MTSKKIKYKPSFFILLTFLVFSLYSFPEVSTVSRIVSFQGKVKLKQKGKMTTLQKQKRIALEQEDAIMVYPGAKIEILLPGGKPKTFTGPFYSTVANLEKPFQDEMLSFFAEPSRWQAIKRLFDEEGEESSNTSRGTQEDSLNFYNEINPVAGKAKIEDETLTPSREKEMKETLATVNDGLNAFPEEKQVVVRVLVYKNFGLHKTSLVTIFDFYKNILHVKDKQPERELIEDYLFNHFLPIVLVAQPANRSRGAGASSHGNLEFSSNLKLWWAAFYFDGQTLKAIDKTIDYSLHPQNIYKINYDKINRVKAKTGSTGGTNSHYLFIVASTNWTELERYDDIETAKKEFLKNSIKEMKTGTIQDYGKVIIKFSL